MTGHTDPEKVETHAVRALIRGQVQGVGFRVWTERNARARGLRGWVRNRRDGSVEALFSGAPAPVKEMVRLCHDGPPDAEVQSVTLVNAGAIVPAGFNILPTA